MRESSQIHLPLQSGLAAGAPNGQAMTTDDVSVVLNRHASSVEVVSGLELSDALILDPADSLENGHLVQLGLALGTMKILLLISAGADERARIGAPLAVSNSPSIAASVTG